MYVYVLFIAVITGTEVAEYQLQSYTRFEECAEAAEILTHNRPNMTARCTRTLREPAKP